MPDSDDRFDKLAKMAFGEAFQPRQLDESDETIESLIAAFEDAAQADDSGTEFWLARDLQKLLGYAKRDNFPNVAQRAREACEGSGHATADHFAGVKKMISLGKGAEREIDDIVLSRYASIRGKDAANRTHFDVGAKVRQTIRELGGAMPETLPPAEGIEKAERRLRCGMGGQKS